MIRRRLLLVATFVVLAAAIVLVFIVSWPDANHRSAVEVVRNAGVSGPATPGAPP